MVANRGIILRYTLSNPNAEAFSFRFVLSVEDAILFYDKSGSLRYRLYVKDPHRDPSVEGSIIFLAPDLETIGARASVSYLCQFEVAAIREGETPSKEATWSDLKHFLTTEGVTTVSFITGLQLPSRADASGRTILFISMTVSSHTKVGWRYVADPSQPFEPGTRSVQNDAR